MKNFLSIGNVSQAVNFHDEELVLVLGENLDLGGNDNRNGVGKSSLVNALSYVLYGEALVKIRKDNLVNKTNVKNMLVTLEFEKDGIKYRIERGRKPNVLRFIANGLKVDVDAETNEAQGEMRMTQVEIERVIGISHGMFKQIVALNTYNEPFLAQRSTDQRIIIEQLLGITKLSDKAEILRGQLKETKDAIKEEEFKITATKETNKRIENNIRTLKIKSSAWQTKQTSSLESHRTSIAELEKISIASELKSHTTNEESTELNRNKEVLDKETKAVQKEINLYKRNLKLAEANLEKTSDNTCPTCSQDMDSETHERVHTEYEVLVSEAEDNIIRLTKKVDGLVEESEKYIVRPILDTFYGSIADAYQHQSTLTELGNSMTRIGEETNPYLYQIETLSTTGIKIIDSTIMDQFISLRDHQEFLLKLLINKDSFIRKKIIDQNLLYLNNRLSHYIDDLGLPHEVKFQSDLEVEITALGKEYDFDNLSRGERTRLILALSWAFRDVYESLTDKINLLFIDELLDSGLDTSGVEGALGSLKSMTRDQKRNIFLISHRDELIGRVSSILKVIKSNGFTEFDSTDTNLI